MVIVKFTDISRFSHQTKKLNVLAANIKHRKFVVIGMPLPREYVKSANCLN